MVTIMLIGDPASCAKARTMIEEAVDNKEQKAKQRHKEYEKKKDAKVADDPVIPRLLMHSASTLIATHWFGSRVIFNRPLYDYMILTRLNYFKVVYLQMGCMRCGVEEV